MKKILVATDFSAAALNAANYAADMAIAINADLLLVNICPVPVSLGDVPSGITTTDMMEVSVDEITQLKEQLIKKTNGKITIETEVKTGTFYIELENICIETEPYIVIMGSQGKGAAERFLLGSHAVYTMKHLLWSLITVPPQVKFSSIKKIGLACDFSKVVETTPVDEISMLVNDFAAELHILNTGKKDEFDPETVFQSGLLQEMVKGLKPSYHLLTSDDTEKGIIDFAEKKHIDLLIILPKKDNLFDKLMHKSHTRQFVLHSPVPVMALHEHI